MDAEQTRRLIVDTQLSRALTAVRRALANGERCVRFKDAALQAKPLSEALAELGYESVHEPAGTDQGPTGGALMIGWPEQAYGVGARTDGGTGVDAGGT